MNRNTLEGIVTRGLVAMMVIVVVWIIVGLSGLGTALQNRGMTQVHATVTDTEMVGTETGGITTAQVRATLDGEVVNRTVDLAEVYREGEVVTLDYRPVQVAALQLTDPLDAGTLTVVWKLAALINLALSPLLIAGVVADTCLRMRDRRVMAS